MHSIIIQYMRSLGYQSNDNGVCYGLASMAIKAFLIGKFDTFKERCTLLENLIKGNTTAEKFKNLVENAEKRKKEGLNITGEKELYLTMRAFFEEVELFYAPFKYPHLFEDNIALQDICATSKLLLSQDENEEFIRISEIAACSGIYDKHEQNNPLISFFKELEINNKPVALLISSIKHAVSLLRVQNEWVIINNHCITVHATSDALVTALMQCMCPFPTCVALNIQLLDKHSIQHDGNRVANPAITALNNLRNTLEKSLAQRSKWSDPISGASWLNIAARDDASAATVTALLNNNAPPNAALKKGGTTPLLIAALRGHVEIVRALLQDQRTDPNQADRDGETPLFIAAQEGHFEIVMALLQHKQTDPNQADRDGATPLFIAAQKGHTEIVAAILAHYDKPNENQADAGDSPEQKPILIIDPAMNASIPVLLRRAETNGCKEQFARLFGKHNGTLSNFTPLHAAVFFRHFEIVKILLENGANLTAKTAEGFGVFDMTIGNSEVLDFLNKKGNELLQKFFEQSNEVECKNLIDAGFNFYSSSIFSDEEKKKTELFESLSKHQRERLPKLNIDKLKQEILTTDWKIIFGGENINHEQLSETKRVPLTVKLEWDEIIKAEEGRQTYEQAWKNTVALRSAARDKHKFFRHAPAKEHYNRAYEAVTQSAPGFRRKSLK